MLSLSQLHRYCPTKTLDTTLLITAVTGTNIRTLAREVYKLLQELKKAKDGTINLWMKVNPNYKKLYVLRGPVRTVPYSIMAVVLRAPFLPPNCDLTLNIDSLTYISPSSHPSPTLPVHALLVAVLQCAGVNLPLGVPVVVAQNMTMAQWLTIADYVITGFVFR